MSVKVLRHTIINKSIDDIIREILQEGWQPITIKGDRALFKLSNDQVYRAMKANEN